MDKQTKKELKNLLKGDIIPLTKDTSDEVDEIITSLNDFNSVKEVAKSQYRLNVSKIKELTKLIELNSLDDFVKWLDNQNTDSSITYNFHNSTVNQLNQESNFSNSPTTINPIPNKKKKSFIEKLLKLITENKLISGIILVIITEEITIGKIYKFILSLFNN